MKKYSRYLLTLLAVLLVLLPGTTVWAESKSYAVPSANFVVQIHEDGSAEIEETWTVSYQTGTFTRFYREILSAPTSEEAISKISVQEVSIDGIVCNSTDDIAGRPDYHYNLSKTSGGMEISAYLESSNVTHVYQFRYTLHDVVKKEGDHYLFVFRFIPENFEKPVDNVTIAVNAPKDTTVKCLYSPTDTVQSTDNTLMVSGSRKNGVFKVRVRIDGNVFGNLTVVEQKPSKSRQPNTVGSCILFIGLIVVLWYFISNAVFKLRLKIRPNLVDDVAKKWVPHHVDPLAFAYHAFPVSTKRFSVILLRMHQAQLLRIEENSRCIWYCCDHTSTRQFATVIRILETCRSCEQQDNEQIHCSEGESESWHNVSLGYFQTSFLSKEAQHWKPQINSEMEQLLALPNDKALIKDLHFVRRCIRKQKKSASPNELASHLDGSYRDVALYCRFLCFYSRISVLNNPNKSNWNMISDVLITNSLRQKPKIVKSSSDSGCSSCSSCSSCSGCGGGGAD